MGVIRLKGAELKKRRSFEGIFVLSLAAIIIFDIWSALLSYTNGVIFLSICGVALWIAAVENNNKIRMLKEKRGRRK
jgi:hypothetical protein